MASPKMTFSLPQSLASQFLRRVSARQRSRYMAEALAWKLKVRDKMLNRACDIANGSRQVRALEREFDALPDDLMEPWNEAPSR